MRRYSIDSEFSHLLDGEDERCLEELGFSEVEELLRWEDQQVLPGHAPSLLVHFSAVSPRSLSLVILLYRFLCFSLVSFVLLKSAGA